MTTEQKAKAYDEALINGSRLWECGEITKENYEYIFPELKKNEDDKIRKYIINHFQGHLDACHRFIEDGMFPPFTAVEMKMFEESVDWLEKQDNRKPTDKVEPKFKVGDYIERKDGLGCHAKIIFVGGNVYGCEKLIYPEDSSPFFEFMFKNQEEFQISSDFQQKPSWSEEDSTKFNATIAFLKNPYLIKDNKGLRDKTIEWLQSLKERVQSQPKQEWSKEDEERWLSCIKRLSTGNIEQPETINTIWLKSIKDKIQPQSQWKPSDEQLEALEHSLGDYNITVFEDRHKILTSLYQDLKELKRK